MKQLLLIFISIALLRGFACGQVINTVPNGGFENWDSTVYTDLDSAWVTTNMQSITTYGKASITRVNGKSGFAARVQTFLAGPDTVTGYMEVLGPTVQKPTGLTGYYRSHIVGNDTAWIAVGFEQSGNTLYIVEFPIIASADTFTFFNFNIDSFAGAPDKFGIVASLTDLLGQAIISKSSPGSWLEIDQLAFTGTQTPVQIPDGNFETWSLNTIYNPASWQSAPSIVGNNSTGVSRSINHSTGAYSVKIVAQRYFSGAQLTSGHFVTEDGASFTEGGEPFNHQIDTLTGYYKYNTLGSDHGMIQMLFQNGNILVGYQSYNLPPAQNWTYFQIPIKINAVPDTMQIDISASALSNGAADSSTLYLDDLKLKSQNSGVFNAAKPSFGISVFPNPAQNQLNIRFGSNAPSKFGLKIYNLEGGLIIDKDFNTSSSTVSIPIDQLSFGLYFYEVTANRAVVRNKFVKD